MEGFYETDKGPPGGVLALIGEASPADAQNLTANLQLITVLHIQNVTSDGCEKSGWHCVSPESTKAIDPTHVGGD